MKILIIGGTGVLSTAVTAEALRRGISVTMINRGNRSIPIGVEHIKADKNNYSDIANALKGRSFDAVMDYLCFTDEETEKSVSFYSNYTKQYFYISSCAVYDTASLRGQLLDEDSKKVLPIWKYSIDKWQSEEKLTRLLKDSDVSYTIIRPCVTYDDTRIPYGIMPQYGYHWTLCARIMAGKPVITWNSGANRCNMTRVEDFAVGVVGLIGNPKAYREAFNVCGNETPSFMEVLNVVGDYLNKNVVIVNLDSEFYAKEDPSRSGEILGGRSIDTLNSNNKLCNAVPSFKQTIGIKDGVIKTLKSYETNHYEKGIDWKFDANTDRIIKKWCKIKGIDYSDYNLQFKDYLGTASFNDRFNYWMIVHNMEWIIVLINRTKSKIKKIIK